MRRIWLLAALALVAGCGNMLNPEGRTAKPSPSPLPSGVANLTNSGQETLAPGRYSRPAFTPRVTFEIGENWYGRQVFHGFFDIQQGDETDPHVIAVQFARPDEVYGADGSESSTDAAHAVAILETNPDLEVIETSSSQMGGLEGSQITIENATSAPVQVMDIPPRALAINPERRLWIAFFDTDDGVLAIMVGGSVERWDETLAVAEPVLESIRIDH